MDEQNPILAPLDPETIARHEKTKRELERRKLDRCGVHNFTNELFTVIYNGYANAVPEHTEENHSKTQGGCNAIFFRYIAEPFAIKLVDHVIIQRGGDEVAKVNKQREDLGQPKLVRMQKNEVLGMPEYNISNIEVRRPLMRQVWKGVVEEYGMNNIVEQKIAKQQDTRPVDEQLFEEIDKENLVALESPISQAPISTPAPDAVPPPMQPQAENQSPTETSIEDLPMA